MVAYFLRGTAFALEPHLLENLKKALTTFNVISNGYSVPQGVSGRHVSYGEPIQTEVVPAYAYLALAMPRTQGDIDSDLASTFMKLYRIEDPYFLHKLTDGKPKSGSEYLSSVGA